MSCWGELLGNFPQAFSHIGLVNAAWAIHPAEERRRWRLASSTRGIRPVGAWGGVPGQGV
ncbi:hypothetical protein [Archangium violaceum]|uniref:GH15-like domain-containing protein n=1 Tax=Archangium violaceum Cb vi76 TaxID=1406225 RepID=A0A084STP4_9BACT|nr:hypothetical protein [Archangium violaceum]KFA91829.1 hypothetical protein Q664_19810 [Archangium violaceum Cb vi76]